MIFLLENFLHIHYNRYSYNFQAGQPYKRPNRKIKGDAKMGFMLLAGGFLVIIFAVVVSVVSSVVSAVAADQDVED